VAARLVPASSLKSLNDASTGRHKLEKKTIFKNRNGII